MGELTPGQVLVGGRYVIGRPLGEGRFSTVYAARDRKLERPCALKVLSENATAVHRASLSREAAAGKMVRHESLCRVLDSGVIEDGRDFLSLERLGLTLADVLERLDRLGPDDAIHVVRRVIVAVQAAHEVRLVHGNLRSQKVYLQRSEPNGGLEVKIAGLGARVGDVDAHDDLFACGALLHQTWTGRPPYSGLDHRMPAALSRIVARAMKQDARRFHTATEMLEALDDAVASTSALAAQFARLS